MFRATHAVAAAILATALLTHPYAPAAAQSGASAPARADTGTAGGDVPDTLPAVQVHPPARAGGGTRPAAPPAAAAPAPAPEARRHTDPLARLTHPVTGEAGPPREAWTAISAEAVNAGPLRLPVGRGHTGPSVLRVQVLLSRALFSPGMLDGRWGKNTQHAVAWFQAREGLPTTGAVDSATYARLAAEAGAPEEAVRVHVLTEDDVRGPFVRIPDDIYAHARLRCSCYESLAEKLTERFHATGPLLQKLNPGVDLNAVAAGTTLHVPAVRDPVARAAGEVAQLVVSGTGNYLHALDGEGRLLYHFPATLGSSFDPSPSGNFFVRSIHPDPWWNYQPRLLAHVANDRPNAMIPPGPNNAVGVVWMSLSVPHYGIHGTRSPETIGYATSAGCVRLTNWDASFLSHRLPPGTPVAFHGTRAGPAPAPAAPREVRQAASLLGVPVDSVPATADDGPPQEEAPPAP